MGAHDKIRLVLASSSPARLRVLRDAGLDPEVVISGVNEETVCKDTPGAVVELAERKAAAVADRCSNALVVGCDSMLDLDGIALGKPANADEAAAFWRRLAGRHATLFTGHCLIDTRTGRRISDVAHTVVRFAMPSEAEITAYVATGEPLALAGAFSIEGFGAPFVDGIDGDPSNVLGLSLPLLRLMLGEIEVVITDLWRQSPPPARPV